MRLVSSACLRAEGVSSRTDGRFASHGSKRSFVDSDEIGKTLKLEEIVEARELSENNWLMESSSFRSNGPWQSANRNDLRSTRMADIWQTQ